MKNTVPCMMLVLACVAWRAQCAGEQEPPPEAGVAKQEDPRRFLPDLSEGRTGVLGPFYWGRSLDLGEDARFADERGLPCRGGEFLWCLQFARGPREKSLNIPLHGRHNFVSRQAELAYAVQPAWFLHNTAGAHNSKIIFGYVRAGLRFQHGDNTDLAHLADSGRVCVFFPVRKDERADPLKPESYYLNHHYAAQAACVIEFRKGEMIHYEWFRGGAEKLDAHILFDLVPYFGPEQRLLPAVTRPILRFDVEAGGGWKLRIKRDGRAGCPDLNDDASFDHVFTHQSAGAKPYTVDLSAEDSAWAMSTFSPGGSPMDTSEILIGLRPYDRRTGQAAPWPDRTLRIRDVKLEALEEAIRKGEAPRK